jgi:hypothetical protein
MATVMESIVWFKHEFRQEINASLTKSLFSIDLITALAMQETSFIWGSLAGKGLLRAEILPLCTGDTLDSPNRSAFPKTRTELENDAQGKVMFVIAREALLALGKWFAQYKRLAKKNKNKFCHGFGIFQYDLQHFKSENQQFFLEKKWHDFETCLQFCLSELDKALARTYSGGKSTLSDKEMVYVAIAYNCGKANLNKDFKQGYRDSDGIYYGEHIWNYLQLAKQVP